MGPEKWSMTARELKNELNLSQGWSCPLKQLHQESNNNPTLQACVDARVRCGLKQSGPFALLSRETKTKVPSPPVICVYGWCCVQQPLSSSAPPSHVASKETAEYIPQSYRLAAHCRQLSSLIPQFNGDLKVWWQSIAPKKSLWPSKTWARTVTCPHCLSKHTKQTHSRTTRF